MSTIAAPSAGKVSTVRPFGWRDKIGYMFGDFGNDFTFMMSAFFLSAFYIKGMGIDPIAVGTVFLVARFIDAFTDVGMGVIVDRSKPTAAGRFRPWILRGAVPVALAMVAVFAMYWFLPVGEAQMGAKIAWMWVTYFLWGSVFYTMINIPYGSMASAISPEADHRSQLSVFRSMGASLAGIVISLVVPLIAFEGKEILTGRFPIIAVVFGVLAVVCYMLCFVNVQERVVIAPQPKGERGGAKALVKGLFTNRALGGLILAAIMLLFASLFAGSVSSFLWLEYFEAGQLASIGQILQFLPALALAAFAPRLARRYGKKEIGVIGVALCGLLHIGLYFVDLRTSPFAFLAVFGIAVIGLGLFNVLVWAFITDVIDHQEVKTHLRNDGVVYAVYSWARKFGQALAGGLGSMALGWIGYQTATGGESVTQSEETIQGIWMLSTLLPGLMYLVCAVALWLVYPLSKKVVDANIAELKTRRAQAEAAATR
ncbi:MFS transporter [Tessaracoccus lapidicaptus]|uniref:MFS transporter n=1 Tax=Tessaracoccus lapidicaptus TaxID=1427523 RepID=UPI00333EDF78